MSVQNGFQKASYKDVEFPIDGKFTISNNNKTAVHHFLNSDTPLVEYLGIEGKVFSFPAIVNSTSFSDYNNQKKRLEKVLNEQSSGILIHPTIGRQLVCATGILVSESLQEINTARYNLTFTETTDPEKIYTKDAGNKNFVLKKIDDTKTALSNYFTKNFSVLIPRIKNNFIDTKKFVTSSLESVNNIVSTINSTGDTLSEYTRSYQDISTNIATLIKTPAEFVSRMQGLWNSILTITDNTVGLFGINLDLIDTSDLTSTGQSSIAKQIISNEVANRNLNNINAILNTFELANDINYESQEELQDTIDKINEKYNLIIEDLDQDTASELELVRSQSFLYLKSVKGKLARTISIHTAPTNLTALSYQYYNNITRAEEIQKLNNIVNNDYVYGKLNILEF